MKFKVLVKQVNGVVVPVRAHDKDAAYDVFATSEPIIVGKKFERPLDGINAWSKIDYIEYKTNLFLAPQDYDENLTNECFAIQSLPKIIKFHLEGFARSSICKKNMVLANSVATLDNPYRNEVTFRFKYLFQPEDLILVPEAGRMRIYGILAPENVYANGDRIIQIKARIDHDIEFPLVETLDDTARGMGGFGSTGA